MRNTKRRANGSGTIYKRKDGRYVASMFVHDLDGERLRLSAYGPNRREAWQKLVIQTREVSQRRQLAPETWNVGHFLDHWLDDVVAIKNRPRTVDFYRGIVRRSLKPGLGRYNLKDLGVADVQAFFNRQLRKGASASQVHKLRSTLRAALSRAEREELIERNVARLIELPSYLPHAIEPWSPHEVKRFLGVAQTHSWYLAYVMLLIYGLRRGEVLGLRWCDVDFERRELHVRQQLQRVDGHLSQENLKTRASARDLPLIELLDKGLSAAYLERYGATPRKRLTDEDPIGRQLVFVSRTGTPIDPKNFVRTFYRLSEKAGVPKIAVHHARHTAATVLKDFDVPVREAQAILGHTSVMTTLQIYQHGTSEAQRTALEHIERALVKDSSNRSGEDA